MSATSGLMRDPGSDGRYGDFGGRFVPESLVPACQELEAGFSSAWADPEFRSRLDAFFATMSAARRRSQSARA